MGEKYRPAPERKKPARVSDQIVDFMIGLAWGGDPKHDFDFLSEKLNAPFRKKKPRK